jgi:hypothetical protein
MKTVFTFLSFLIGLSSVAQVPIVVNNLKPRIDDHGEVIDAHDGRVVKFGSKFYWYGTAYGNTTGFLRTNYFQCFSSLDLTHWKKDGPLLVNAPPGIYYRPHVVYNVKTKKYVLWYNWYPKLWDGKYGVAISGSPTGPFKIVNPDVKLANSKYGVGDFGLFVDDDNTAYIAYNTIDGHKGSVEKLSKDYLSSTLENGGFITEGCEAGAIFKRNKTYYLLTDYTCCFCSQGSGVRVYTSERPTSGYQLQNNINRYPGVPSNVLVDGSKSPNLYLTLSKQGDGSFGIAEINLSSVTALDQLNVYQFTGNHDVVSCGDTISNHDKRIFTPMFELFVKTNHKWTKVKHEIHYDKTSIHNVVSMKFDSVSTTAIRVKPLPDYPLGEIFINEIETYFRGKEAKSSAAVASAFLIATESIQGNPIIPAQQTFVMPLKTTEGIQYIWMGDLWGSDNLKGNDYQYWGSPLRFDRDGNIEVMQWTDEWQATIID